MCEGGGDGAGESTRFFAKLAGELKVYLTVPLLEVDPRSGEYYNTVVLISPDTTYCGYYRKLNPWPFAERGWATPGDLGHAVIDTPYGRMALLICFDINFEPPRLKALGVDHLLYPIAWVEDTAALVREAAAGDCARNDINIIGRTGRCRRDMSRIGTGGGRRGSSDGTGRSWRR